MKQMFTQLVLNDWLNWIAVELKWPAKANKAPMFLLNHGQENLISQKHTLKSVA